ncbi:MAG: 4-hydroxy-tetrahydrodipicolinate synthase [Rickettsiales bacterium]
MIKGIYTALITPFTSENTIDEKKFGDFIEWQIEEGVHGLVPCGTTGESPTLTHDEHNRVIELCVEAAAGRAHIMAGTGSNSTDEAIMTTQHAKKVGADSVLVVAPYYNKPNQEGIYQHFKAINDAVEIPIIIYNVPSRSVVNISDDTIARLAHLPNVVGVKDATGDLARPYLLRNKLKDLDKDFFMFSGEDMTAVAFNASGGHGCISVSANIVPSLCAKIQNKCFSGDYYSALELQDKLTELNDAMFRETSPCPVKYAASLIGKSSPYLRLPLVEVTETTKNEIKKILINLDLL